MPRILPGAPPTRGSGEPWGMVPQVPDPLDTANLAILGDIANHVANLSPDAQQQVANELARHQRRP